MLASSAPFFAMMATGPLVKGTRAHGAAEFVRRKMAEAEANNWSLAKLEKELAREKIVKRWGHDNIQTAFARETSLRVQREEGFWVRLIKGRMNPTNPAGEVAAAAPAAAPAAVAAGAGEPSEVAAARVAEGSEVVSTGAERVGMGGGPSVAGAAAVGRGRSAAEVVKTVRGRPEAVLAKARSRIARQVPVAGPGGEVSMTTVGSTRAARKAMQNTLRGGKRIGLLGGRAAKGAADAGGMGWVGKGALGLAGFLALWEAHKWLSQRPAEMEQIRMGGELQRAQISAQYAGQPTAQDMVTDTILQNAEMERRAALAAEFGGIDVGGYQQQADQARAAEQMELLRQLQIRQKMAQLTPNETYVGGGF